MLVRVVSSWSSRQAVSRGVGSDCSTLPDIGAYLCLERHLVRGRQTRLL